MLVCEKNIFKLKNIFSRMYLKGSWGITLFEVCLKSFLISAIICVLSKSFYEWFLSTLSTIVGVGYKWFSKLNLYGLGFKSFYSKANDKFRIDLGYSHIFQFNDILKQNLNIFNKKLYNKKFILVTSINKNVLNKFLYRILKLRFKNRYLSHGVNVHKIFKKPVLKRKIKKKSYR